MRHANSLTGLKHSRSLAISPNLDALLEFEERHRAAANGTTSPLMDDNTPLTPGTPGSLPPPPRTPRTPGTPLGDRTEQKSPITHAFGKREQACKTPLVLVSSSESNPYINPAPTFEDLQLSESTPSRSCGNASGGSQEPAATGSKVTLGKFSEQHASSISGIGRSPAPRSRQFDAHNSRHLTTEEFQSFHKLPALPWTPKAKATGSQDVDQTTLKADKDVGLQELQTAQRLARTRPGYRKMRTLPGVKDNHAGNFLDMSEGKLKQGSHRTNANSHGTRRKGLRIRTADPSLGADPMLNFLNLSQALPDTDRQSFIDINSPSSEPGSGPQTPSLETTANPPKHRQKRGEHLRSLESLDRRTTPLPPTTNLLGTNERAELIRKTRKLARVFGKTPEAGTLLHAVSDSRHPAVLATSPDHRSRRHSLPLAVKTADAEALGSNSPVSFIDLSDEDDNQSAITSSPKIGRRRRSIASVSPSENITPDTYAEEERRRKREKLARLHRFLGSRVPPSLAFGLDESDISLPPERMLPGLDDEEPQRKIWRRRRSSSAAEPPSAWSDKADRIKADLDSREKAINVKRAQKMEKVFGVAPPQTLYHTRHIQSPSLPSVLDMSENLAKAERNRNRTAYTKHRSRREARSHSSDSRRGLLCGEGDGTDVPSASWSTSAPRSARRSSVYTHYEHSLNSLHDILERDDRASLAELHRYLNNTDQSPTSPLIQITPTKDRRASIASSTKSDRRHSLPARTSMISIASEVSVTTPKPDLTDFQLRRRRAAKLTNFFGVDYRELINDVLESIETGLEHERKRGTLRAEEVEDLLQRLGELKVKRRNI